jgi:glucokinase
LFPDGIRCRCGSIGCLEAYASATAVVRRFHEAVAAGRRTRLAAKLKQGEQITARDITTAAKSGDRLCLRLTQETGKFLGIAAVNMIHVLNVDMIVFAGGMTAAGSILLQPLRDTVRERAMAATRRGVKIVFSRLGNDAGLIGAAGYSLSQTKGTGKRKGAK